MLLRHADFATPRLMPPLTLLFRYVDGVAGDLRCCRRAAILCHAPMLMPPLCYAVSCFMPGAQDALRAMRARRTSGVMLYARDKDASCRRCFEAFAAARYRPDLMSRLRRRELCGACESASRAMRALLHLAFRYAHVCDYACCLTVYFAMPTVHVMTLSITMPPPPDNYQMVYREYTSYHYARFTSPACVCYASAFQFFRQRLPFATLSRLPLIRAIVAAGFQR